MADIRVSWARLRTPQPSATIAIAWADVTIPAGAATGLFLFDRPRFVLAGFSTEPFDPGTDEVDLGQPQKSFAHGTNQSLSAAGTPLSFTDRPGAVRAGAPTQIATLAIAGAPPLSAVLPAFTVEIDADPDTTGDFVIGTSTLNGADTISPDERWVAVPLGDVRTVATRRGRSREDQDVDAGTCSIVLDGYNGAYDPDNPSTPYQLAGDIKLRTGMGVRVKVTLSGTDVYLFTGSLEQTAADHGLNPTVTWTAVDRLADLGQAAFAPVAYSREGELSSDRVGWLLDYAGVPSAARLVTLGSRSLSATEGGGTVLSNLHDVALAEQGRVFADRLNRLVVSQRWEDYADASLITLSDSGGAGTAEYDTLAVEPGAAQVINDATVKRTRKTFTTSEDGTTSEATVDSSFTGTAAPSQERFGKRSLNGGQGVEASLASDTDMQALADYLAQKRCVPASRVSSVVVNLAGLPTAQLSTLCQMDLGDRLTVARTTVDGRSLSWQVYAEGVDHAISTTGWSVTLATAPVLDLFLGASPFRVGTSTLDGADLVATY